GGPQPGPHAPGRNIRDVRRPGQNRRDNAPMTEQTISLERLEETINVFGSFDENIRMIEHEMGVTVVSRDSMLKVAGEDPEQVMYAVRAIESLMTLSSKGETINEQNVRYIIQLVREGKEGEIHHLAGDVLCVTA